MKEAGPTGPLFFRSVDNLFGIDIGSSYCRGAFWNEDGAPEVLRNAAHLDSTALLPSVVISQEGQKVTGWLARRKKNREQACLKRRWAQGEKNTAEDLACLLREVKTVTSGLSKTLTPKAAFSFPGSLGKAEQTQFENAARGAGFEVAGSLPETAAAALAHAFLKKKTGTVGVFNFGGGFFEFAVFLLEPHKVRLLGSESLALGGEDLDRCVGQALLKEMGPVWTQAISKSPELYQKVLEEAEKTRCALSHRGSCDLQIEDAAVPQKFTRAFSRFELAKCVRENVEKTVGVCESAMKKAGVLHQDIHEVLLSGGVTRMPYVQEIVEKIFRKKGNMEINPDLAVVYGTLIYASMQSGLIMDWKLEI